MPTNFTIRTEHFEGPLELLLGMIEKRKLFINDFSLAQIADDYISYINQTENFPLQDISNFILIASTLVLIKSKSLLPSLELTDEEEASIEDLETRLKEYKLIKFLSSHVKEKFGMNIIFESPSIQVEPIFHPDKTISQNSLSHALEEVIARFPKKEKKENPKASIKKVISLEEMINNLTERIKSNLKMTFRDFSKGVSEGVNKSDKVNTIVGFLAVLELFKGGIINLRQSDNFADIHIESQDVGVPRY
jgi:segregation and condensation protein A